MKVIQADHVVLTLSLGTPTSQGMPKKEVDELVNKRLKDGYDEFETHLLKTNFDERQQPTDAVILYVFKAYEKEAAPAARAKKE
jgi:hypothetical protein